jgi:outer membrane protein OmpA-like peptidoglycan-associated protein
MRTFFARLVPLLLILAACESTPEPAPAPPPPPPAANNQTTPASRSIILTVNFQRDSWVISNESKQALDNVATAMRDQRLAGTRYVIQGHTDVTGRLGHNMSLSKLRAAAVTDYLVSRGVDRSILTSEGFGPLRLLDTANPKSPTNRRVEIVTTRS